MTTMTAPPVRTVRLCRVSGGSDWLDVMSLGRQPLANAYLDPAALPGLTLRRDEVSTPLVPLRGSERSAAHR